MASTINASNGPTSGLISTGDASGILQLQVNNGTAAVTLNTSGAVGVGSSPGYGSSGQVLISGGSSAAPSWGAVAVPSSSTIASPTFTGTIYANGSYKGNVTAMAALDIDCSVGNYFTKTIAGASAFTFSNAPSGSYAFTLELTVTSGSATWPAAVKWPSDTAPTLSTGKTSLLMFVTDDSGTRWRGAALVDYTT